ncbi:DMT family transporter, partial [Candidatus Poribacteria bacterium]|nr:DMT family transporter [Candidatus Poribacteria bacterium]
MIADRSRRASSFAMLGGSAALISVMALLVRATAGLPGVSAYETTFFRFLIGGGLVGFTLLARRRAPAPRNYLWLGIRGLCGAGAMLIYFHSITHIGLAKGTVLLYTNVIWAALLAPLVLGDRIDRRLWASVGLAFAGVYLLLVPDGGLGGVSRGDLLALAAGLVGGIAVVAVKRVRETDDTSTVFLALAMSGVLLTVWPAARGGFGFDARAWPLLAGIGVTGTAAKLLSDSAYRYVRGEIWSEVVYGEDEAGGVS